MKISSNTTLLDLALNLSGSLAGIPVVLSQLPSGERVGFSHLPEVWEDVDATRPGQTWTPVLEGLDVEITVDTYNTLAVDKGPYTTDLTRLQSAVDYGSALLEALASEN